MLTIFNERELWSTFDAGERIRIQDALSKQGIRFYTREKPTFTCYTMMTDYDMHSRVSGKEYIIYVHKRDVEQALPAIEFIV